MFAFFVNDHFNVAASYKCTSIGKNNNHLSLAVHTFGTFLWSFSQCLNLFFTVQWLIKQPSLTVRLLCESQFGPHSVLTREAVASAIVQLLNHQNSFQCVRVHHYQWGNRDSDILYINFVLWIMTSVLVQWSLCVEEYFITTDMWVKLFGGAVRKAVWWGCP